MGCLENTDLENADHRPQTSKTQTSKTQTLKTQTSKTRTLKTRTSKTQTSKTQTLKAQTSKTRTSKTLSLYQIENLSFFIKSMGKRRFKRAQNYRERFKFINKLSLPKPKFPRWRTRCGFPTLFCFDCKYCFRLQKIENRIN